MADLLINIDVDDLQRAITFYTRVFDLTIGRRFGAGAVELLGAALPIYLLVKAPGTRSSETSSTVRDYRRHWTPLHLDFVVSDIDAAIARAIDAGAKREGVI